MLYYNVMEQQHIPVARDPDHPVEKVILEYFHTSVSNNEKWAEKFMIKDGLVVRCNYGNKGAMSRNTKACNETKPDYSNASLVAIILGLKNKANFKKLIESLQVKAKIKSTKKIKRSMNDVYSDKEREYIKFLCPSLNNSRNWTQFSKNIHQRIKKMEEESSLKIVLKLNKKNNGSFLKKRKQQINNQYDHEGGCR